MHDILIIATSARLLAQLCAAGGQPADVMDCFGDSDTLAAARRFQLLPCERGADQGPDGDAVLHAIGMWRKQHPEGRALIGAGFEHRPALLGQIEKLLPLCGNAADSVARCKSPAALYAACQALALATVEIRRTRPARRSMGRWLRKRAGGAGGAHVAPRPWSVPATRGDSVYWQRWAPGEPVSLLFLTQARTTIPLGVHRQYCAPGPGSPYRFGGVVAAQDLGDTCQSALFVAATALADHFSLRGLNGLDALWDGDTLRVLELNPRPPASLALQESAQQIRLLQVHIGTVGTHASAALQPGYSQRLSAGMALVYASRTLSIPADFQFPPGCHDLPCLPHTYVQGEPVCSLHVAEGGVEELRSLFRLLQERLLPVAGAEVVDSL